MKPIAAFALVFAAGLSLAAAQSTTAPATTSTAPAPAPAPAKTTGQVGPGSTGTISKSGGIVQPTGGKTKKILDGMLTSQTRQNLLDAMNSVTPPAAASASSSNTNTAPPPAAAGH